MLSYANLPTPAPVLIISLLILIIQVTIRSVKSDQDYCNHEYYCGPNTPNILCLRGGEMCRPYREDCREVLLDYNFRKGILRTHNRVRHDVATARISVGHRYYTVPNMMALSYSHELELAARCWVLVCPTPIQICNCSRLRDIPNVAQNIYWGYHHSIHDESGAKFYVDYWFGTADNVEDSIVSNDIDSFSGNFSDAIPALNLINSQSYLIGCAKVRFREEVTIVVCNYAPGPTPGQQLLENKPPACSRCRGGLQCNAHFPGLCGVTRFPDTSYSLGSSSMYINAARRVSFGSVKFGVVFIMVFELSWKNVALQS